MYMIVEIYLCQTKMMLWCSGQFCRLFFFSLESIQRNFHGEEKESLFYSFQTITTGQPHFPLRQHCYKRTTHLWEEERSIKAKNIPISNMIQIERVLFMYFKKNTHVHTLISITMTKERDHECERSDEEYLGSWKREKIRGNDVIIW